MAEWLRFALFCALLLLAAFFLLMSVATSRMPITPIIELTAIFSQMPTSFIPTKTTPAPIR